MLAGAQLGITVCSILLGRVGEPAVAHLLEKPFDLLGIPDAVLHTVSFVVAIVDRGDAARAARRDGAEEHRDRRAGVDGDAADPAVPVVGARGAAVHRVLQLVRATSRCGCSASKPRTNSTTPSRRVELSEMIAESLSEGLLDPEEHNRLTRALQIRNRVVDDVAVPLREIRAVPVAAHGSGPTVAAIERRWPRPATPASRSSTPIGAFIGYLHIKDVLPLVDDPDAVHRLCRWCGRCRGCPRRLPLPDALSRLRRNNSHLALVTDRRRRGVGDGGAGGSGRGPGGRPCATGRTVSERLARARDARRVGLDAPRERHPPATRADALPRDRTARARLSVGKAHPVWDFLFTYYSLRPRQLRLWHPGFGVVLAGRMRPRRYLGRSGLRDARRRRHRQPRPPAGRAGHRAVHRRSAARDRVAAGPAELLRTARVGDGLPERPTCATARCRCGSAPRHRCRGRVDAVALQPLRCLPVLHRAGRAAQCRGAEPRDARSPPSSRAVCTPAWISTSGPTSWVRWSSRSW